MVLPMRRWFRGGSGDERRARRGGGWGCSGNGEAAKPRGENASRRKSEKQSLAEERAGLPQSFEYCIYSRNMGFPGGSVVKNLLAMQETWI